MTVYCYDIDMSLRKMALSASFALPLLSAGQDIMGPKRPFEDNGNNGVMNLLQDNLRCMGVQLDSAKNIRSDLLDLGPEYTGSHFFFWGGYKLPREEIITNATFSNPDTGESLDQNEMLQTFRLSCVSSTDNQPIREDWENALVTDIFIATNSYATDATFDVDAIQYEYGPAYGHNKVENASDYHVRLAGMAGVTSAELTVAMAFKVRDQYCPCPVAGLIVR